MSAREKEIVEEILESLESVIPKEWTLTRFLGNADWYQDSEGLLSPAYHAQLTYQYGRLYGMSTLLGCSVAALLNKHNLVKPWPRESSYTPETLAQCLWDLQSIANRSFAAEDPTVIADRNPACAVLASIASYMTCVAEDGGPSPESAAGLLGNLEQDIRNMLTVEDNQRRNNG